MIVVGLGGALGAMCRYALSLIPWRGGIPCTYAYHEPGRGAADRARDRDRTEQWDDETESTVISEDRSMRRVHYIFCFFAGDRHLDRAGEPAVCGGLCAAQCCGMSVRRVARAQGGKQNDIAGGKDEGFKSYIPVRRKGRCGTYTGFYKEAGRV